MAREPHFQVGDDLFVRDPRRFIANANCIVGGVLTVSREGEGWAYTITASVGVPWGTEPAPEGQAMRFAEADLGRRFGTPISQLSGRPGHAGYERFKAIAASWGHD